MFMQQRISTLPYSLREKCVLQETSPHLTMYRDVCGRRTRHPRVYTGSNQSPVMIAIEELQLYREKETKILKQEESKRREEKVLEDTGILASHLCDNEQFKTITNSWMFISSCMVICVVQETFNIAFTVLDLEIGLMYPKHSTYLANLIVHLAASSSDSKKHFKDGRISYELWNRLLKNRVDTWYNSVVLKGVDYVIDKHGLPKEFFEVFGCGNESPIKYRMFHDLSTTERIVILHALCCSKLDSKPSLLQHFTEFDSSSLRPTVLGYDARDNKYFYFPIWPEEVRVYAELGTSKTETPPPAPEIHCIARSLSEVEEIVERLQNLGYISLPNLEKPPTKAKARGYMRSMQQKSLVEVLKNVTVSLKEHQSHYDLVQTTVYRRLAESMMGESLIPELHPPTPQVDNPYVSTLRQRKSLDFTSDDEDETEEAEDSSLQRNTSFSGFSDSELSDSLGRQYNMGKETEVQDLGSTQDGTDSNTGVLRLIKSEHSSNTATSRTVKSENDLRENSGSILSGDSVEPIRLKIKLNGISFDHKL